MCLYLTLWPGYLKNSIILESYLEEKEITAFRFLMFWNFLVLKKNVSFFKCHRANKLLLEQEYDFTQFFPTEKTLDGVSTENYFICFNIAGIFSWKNPSSYRLEMRIFIQLYTLSDSAAV